jgi:hypothetical protein
VLSVVLLFQQQAVLCVCVCIQKESHCCEGQLSASGGNQECCSLCNKKMSSSAKKLSKSASKTFQMIKQAYEEEALGHRAVFMGHKCFA